MQNGSITRSTRSHGPDVWEFRWREAGADGKRKHRRMVIGSIIQFSDKSSALLEVAALRREINLNDPRLSLQPVTISELVNHYRQRELATDQHLEDALDQSDLPRLPKQMDSAALGKLHAFRDQCGRGGAVAKVLALGTSYLCQNQKPHERRLTMGFAIKYIPAILSAWFGRAPNGGGSQWC